MTKFLPKPSLLAVLLAAALGILSSHAIARPNSLDSGEAIFEVLASEIALQRGEAGLAYGNYL